VLADEASPRAAQAYMLISMPTGISTICGAFQDILELLVMSAGRLLIAT
jgi:hypothetical protein